MNNWQRRSRRETGTSCLSCGSRCGGSPERIRQRESKALRKLRNFRAIRCMRRYVDARTDFYRAGHDPVAANVCWRETLEEHFVTR